MSQLPASSAWPISKHSRRTCSIMFSKAAVALGIGLCATPMPASAAENLECMSAAYGEPERAILDKNASVRRGDDTLSLAVFELIQARGRACGYLNSWSPVALRLAVTYRWTSEQWFGRKITPAFTEDQQRKLRIAFEPRKLEFIANFSAFVEAVKNGQEQPAPSPTAFQFRKYHEFLTEVGMPRNAQTEQLLDGWLYTEGVITALKEAFSSQ
jgi:hypothetical protein